MSPNGQGQCNVWTSDVDTLEAIHHPGPGKCERREIITLRDRGRVTSITHHKSPGVITSEHENISFRNRDTSLSVLPTSQEANIKFYVIGGIRALLSVSLIPFY